VACQYKGGGKDWAKTLDIIPHESLFIILHSFSDMAKLEQSTDDSIMVAERTIAGAGAPVELPSDTQPIEPLDLEEAQPVRTRLRIYATLLALYVTYLSTSSMINLAN
jgi:hypothetical protein